MIRRAEFRDLPALVEMGRAFHAEAGWVELPWDDMGAAEVLAKFIAHPDWTLLVGEDAGAVVAMAAAVVADVWFCPGEKMGQELFWYVRPDARRGIGTELLAATEDALRALGARTFLMLAVTDLRSEALARLYARRGYRSAERTFIRRL